RSRAPCRTRAWRWRQRYGLSPRETEVFTLLAQGRTRAFIQDELVLSGSTIKTHVSHIYAKMDVHDRQEMMDLIWN
uniref:response regulator transcription factor n=1 Tax=Eggerthella sinensis TaxID=242230 RepID=UPI0022E614DA